MLAVHRRAWDSRRLEVWAVRRVDLGEAFHSREGHRKALWAGMDRQGIENKMEKD
jgi:hypothetical protein